MKTNDTTATMNSELGILPKLISLPKEPENVLWQVIEEKGKDNGSLVALLHYNTNDYNYIVKNSDTTDAKINDVMSSAFYNKWVSDNLKAQIKTRNTGDSVELIGIKRLKPDLFTHTDLSPYNNGSVTPLGEGYLLVSLYAM